MVESAARQVADSRVGRARIYEPSRPEALTVRAAVGLIAESRRRVRYVPVSMSEFVAELVAVGMAPIDVESFADVIEPLSG